METAFNARRQRGRRTDWRKADLTTEFYRRLLDLADIADLAADVGVSEAKSYVHLNDERFRLIDAWRAAKAAQTQTRAPNQAAVAWKRQAAKDPFLPIENSVIAMAIAADERWLKDHPTKRARRVEPSDGQD
jgi:hypothetical protein